MLDYIVFYLKSEKLNILYSLHIMSYVPIAGSQNQHRLPISEIFFKKQHIFEKITLKRTKFRNIATSKSIFVEI